MRNLKKKRIKNAKLKREDLDSNIENKMYLGKCETVQTTAYHSTPNYYDNGERIDLRLYVLNTISVTSQKSPKLSLIAALWQYVCLVNVIVIIKKTH